MNVSLFKLSGYWVLEVSVGFIFDAYETLAEGGFRSS
jgi:hypothetical protein